MNGVCQPLASLSRRAVRFDGDRSSPSGGMPIAVDARPASICLWKWKGPVSKSTGPYLWMAPAGGDRFVTAHHQIRETR